MGVACWLDTGVSLAFPHLNIYIYIFYFIPINLDYRRAQPDREGLGLLGRWPPRRVSLLWRCALHHRVPGGCKGEFSNKTEPQNVNHIYAKLILSYFIIFYHLALESIIIQFIQL